MTVIIDYGVGNLFSLCRSLEFIGQDAVVSGDANVIKNGDRVILPGVGAFGDAARKLRETGLFEIIKYEARRGKPLLGICLGMQLLFDKSYEYGEHEGLGLIKGTVVPIKPVPPENFKIPHIGWNALKLTGGGNNPLLKYIKDGDFVYFVHSYHAQDCEESTIAVTDYGTRVTAAVANGKIFGAQFHPEKSADTGLAILRAFCET